MKAQANHRHTFMKYAQTGDLCSLMQLLSERSLISESMVSVVSRWQGVFRVPQRHFQ